MPNTSVRAAAEGMPTINRRRLLLGIAAASTTAAAPIAVASAAAAAQENPDLVEAWKAFRAAEKEYSAAKDALEWLADEWRHRWPRAPEGARWNGSDGDVETDIAGRAFRDDRGSVEWMKSREQLENSLAWAKTVYPPLPPNASLQRRKRREVAAKWRRDHLRELEEAEAYFIQIGQMREVSGANAAQERLKSARNQIEEAATLVSKEPARTTYGLRLKADAIEGLFDSYGIKSSHPGFLGDAKRLADAVMDLIGEDGGVL